jgi:DNA-binding response OmpR family regulator
MLRASLRHEGYQVETVHNGEDALKIARDWKPHLVLLDVTLPDMNGFEVCRHIRQSEQIDAVPIIMLTAKGLAADKAEAFSAGADDYLVKPVDLDELRMRVGAQIRRAWAISKGQ